MQVSGADRPVCCFYYVCMLYVRVSVDTHACPHISITEETYCEELNSSSASINYLGEEYIAHKKRQMRRSPKDKILRENQNCKRGLIFWWLYRPNASYVLFLTILETMQIQRGSSAVIFLLLFAMEKQKQNISRTYLNFTVTLYA